MYIVMNIGYNSKRNGANRKFSINYQQSSRSKAKKITNIRHHNIKTLNTYYINISINLIMGLTNQLYILIYGICKCINDKKNYLIVDNFLMDATTNIPRRTLVSNVLYLQKINAYVNKTYNLILIDSNDGKDFIKSVPHLDGYVHIADSLVNTELGLEIFKRIYFHPNILKMRTQIIGNIIKSHQLPVHINIIHVRLEQDALLHWGGINNMTTQHFHDKVADKYIQLINTYIDKRDITIVLCSDTKNEISKYLRVNEYNSYLLPKYHLFREYNAITDLVTGKFCNNVFIGSGGSTFSHMLQRYHGNNVKYHSINLNKIV